MPLVNYLSGNIGADRFGRQGRYLPVFASEIYDQNQVAVAEGRTAINLKSVMIGNGITDISTSVTRTISWYVWTNL